MKQILQKEKTQTDHTLPCLTKYISQSGFCSRRTAVVHIKSGQVWINEMCIIDPSYRVKPNDKVLVKGVPVGKKDRTLYILLNKPKDCISTLSDEKGRHCVADIFKPFFKERLFPVGRLDRNTTGVLLMTNDGNLAQRLSHPQFEVPKVYHVSLDHPLKHEDLMEIKHGVKLEDGMLNLDYIGYLKTKSDLLVELHSGKNRVVRRLFEYFGYTVKKLDRVAFAGIEKAGTRPGTWRFLSSQEVEALKH